MFRNIVTGVIILTIPTTLVTLKNDYLPKRPPAMISKLELEALTYLKNQPEGIVLTYPFDEIAANNAKDFPPRPLYRYVSSAYVSAYANQQVYLEDEVNLNITGYNWKERRRMVEEFLDTNDQLLAKKFLKDNNISYIYWLKPPEPYSTGSIQRAKLGETQLGIKRLFENEEVDIYKVR